LYFWTNLNGTWYIYHGTWTHLKDVNHKSLPSVPVSLRVSLFSLLILVIFLAHVVMQLAEALCCKAEGRRYDSRTITLESTQPLTEMSTRNLPGGKGAAGV
jgi:hypothetical protein